MPISLILTPFDYFQIRPSFAVTPNLILEPCHRLVVPTLSTLWWQLKTTHSGEDSKCDVEGGIGWVKGVLGNVKKCFLCVIDPTISLH